MIPETLVDSLYAGPVEKLLPLIPDGSIDCILADPDYNIGRPYNGKSSKLSPGDYLKWSIGWAEQCRRVLKPSGNLFIINYPLNNSYLRVRYLDLRFAEVHEYVWVYKTNIGQSPRFFTTAHRSVLHCTKSDQNRFYKRAVAQPYLNPDDHRVAKLIENGSKGRMPYSWLEFDLVKNVSRSKSFHSCQIPESLTELLLRATTRKNDVVLILFGGSGSEIVLCKRLGRHFLSAEINPTYRRLIRARLNNGGAVPDRYRLAHPRAQVAKVSRRRPAPRRRSRAA